MMATFFAMYSLFKSPRAALYPVGRQAVSLAPRFEPLPPPFPESGKIGLDHMDQCHITGRAHETSDPIQPVLVEPVVGRLLTEEVEPDVKSGPVLDWRSGNLDFHGRVSPDPVAVRPGERFVPPLPDKGEAFAPGRTDGLCDRQELADDAAPACVHGRRSLVLKRF